MTRFQYARCRCCPVHLVLDTATHTVMGTAPDAWDGTVAADRLNRGALVNLPLPFRRRVREWLVVGMGSAVIAVVGYVGLVLFIAVAS